MIYNLLSAGNINQETTIYLPTEEGGSWFKHIALIFEFNLTSGDWKDLKSTIIFRRRWMYNQKYIYEFYGEITPNIEAIVYPLNDLLYLNLESLYSDLILSKAFKYPGVAETISYATSIDLIYEYADGY
ncbi:hypothetical protein NIES4101_28270 (plasmid) [Calothrix sp. NIES-4101]|nr:hypothetical protein NIES4101_28270 [Calothrix sp. NIES-4101]